MAWFEVNISTTGKGRYGVVVEVEDTKPVADSPTRFAMKIQEDGPEYRKELKSLLSMNSKRIVRVKKGKQEIFYIFVVLLYETI